MKREIAVTLDRQFRLVEENFWFSVERKDCLGRWRKNGSSYRDRDLGCRVLESTQFGPKI